MMYEICGPRFRHSLGFLRHFNRSLYASVPEPDVADAKMASTASEIAIFAKQEKESWVERLRADGFQGFFYPFQGENAEFDLQ